MAEQLTDEQVNERFKDFPVRFRSYYKYSFSFTGERDGVKIHASYGGDSADIYRYEVDTEEKPFGSVNDYRYVQIEINGEKVFDHYCPW